MKMILIYLIGFLIGSFAWTYFGRARHLNAVPSPLKVTIIDDGGADISVESTVVPAGRQDKK